MIAKVVRGYRPAGLIRYLFGPGKYEEHQHPRVVASWDGAAWLHDPDQLLPVDMEGEVVEPGEFDLDLAPLTRTMQELAKLAGLPLSDPPVITPQWEQYLRAGAALPSHAPAWVLHYKYDARRNAVVRRQGYVWHCSVRLHPDDPTLTDTQWEHIAQRLMSATGIHQAGARWIAVRHAEDHIHLMATLVSEDTGRRVHPYRDYPKLRQQCRQLERELGLVPTASADKTAPPAPTRGELGKAERNQWATTARQHLRRTVTHAAASVCTGEEFLHELRRDGLNPTPTTGADGEIHGYTVSLPGDLTAHGTPVRYSGTTLAPDLSWPKLLQRWASTLPTHTADERVPQRDRHGALEHATAVVDRATTAIRASGADSGGIAHATGELLATLARGREGHTPGPLTHITDRYDRAARTPHHVLPTHISAVARELRHASRRVAAAGALTGRGNEKLAGTALLLALAGLTAELAAWHQAHGRTHQAAAAGDTATALPTLTPPTTSTRLTATHPVKPPTASRSRPQRPPAHRDLGAHRAESPNRRHRPR